MNQLFLLDAAKKVTGSDYRTAQLIGCSRQRLSSARARNHQLELWVVGALAEIAGLDPAKAICEVSAERADSYKERTDWKRWAGAAVFTFVTGLICAMHPESISYAFFAPLFSIHYAHVRNGRSTSRVIFSSHGGLMQARELIRNPILSYGQTAFFLGTSVRTLRRWEAEDHVPRAPALVLTSIWTGLPVLAGFMWQGWRFGPDQSLRTPGNYPLWPSDLWSLEYLYRNGLFSSAARGDLLSVERLGTHLAPGATAHAWHPPRRGDAHG